MNRAHQRGCDPYWVRMISMVEPLDEVTKPLIPELCTALPAPSKSIPSSTSAPLIAVLFLIDPVVLTIVRESGVV